ncbi:MAG: hypothetical protein RL410_1597 [Actinomycetota bacterium]|jgi:DNA-binding LytR/AlgR family response regulator
MSGLNCLVLDADATALADVSAMLINNPRTECVQSHTNIDNAVKQLDRDNIDVVFVCLVHHTPDSINNTFKTATDGPLFIAMARDENQAMDAYRVGAIDYILKPIDANKIDAALHRIQGLSLQRKQMNNRRITAERNGEMHVIDVRDVMYARSNGDYTVITTSAGDFVSRNSLAALADTFADEGLVRVHRQWVVPIQRIQVLTNDCGQTFAIVEEFRVPVARRCVRTVRDLLV